MTLPVQVGPSTITINRDDRFVVCQPDGRIERLGRRRLLRPRHAVHLGLRVCLNGQRPVLLNSSPIQFFSSRFEYTNDALLDDVGAVDRQTPRDPRSTGRSSGGVHEDLDIVNYAPAPGPPDDRDRDRVRLRRHLRRPRPTRSSGAARSTPAGSARAASCGRRTSTATSGASSIVAVETVGLAAAVRQRPARVRRRDRAEGRLAHLPAVAAADRARRSAGRRRWPATRSRRRSPGDGPTPAGGRDRDAERDRPAGVGPGRPRHGGAPARGPDVRTGVFIPAAGVPWFVTLFGRDTLVVSMQAIRGYPEFAAGALRRLSELQATGDDPERDMEPGKIPHEIRHGELAQLGILPYQPYYGTHDATSLFVIVLSYLYQWLGDVAVLRRYLPNAEAALRWIDQLRRPRPRRVPGVQDPLVARLLQPGLEGRRRRDPARRRHARAAADRAVRAPGLRLRREAPDGRHLRDPRPAGGRAPAAAPRRASCTSGSTTRSGGRPRGPTTSASTATKQPIGRSPRTPATAPVGDRAAGAGRPGRRAAAGRRHVVGLGRSGRSRPTTSRTTRSATTPARVWPHDNAMIAGGFRRYGFDAEAAQVAQGHVRRGRAARRPTACRSCSPACRATRGELPGPVPRARTSRRRGPPARSSG